MSEPTASNVDRTRRSPNRRRVRISIRVLMLIVLIFGLWLGWRVHEARLQRETVAAVERYGGWVHFDYEFVNGTYKAGRQPSAPRWLRTLVGDEFFRRIYQVSFVYDDSTGKRFDLKNDQPCDEVLARLAECPDVRVLMLHGHQATDRGLQSIGKLRSLEKLYIWDAADVTDAGVAELAGLSRLNYIHIGNSQMTDTGLATLGNLVTLEDLSLQGNHFTDAGLARITRLIRLKTLYVGLGKSEITDAGLVHLKALKDLELLDFQHSQVTDNGLKHLEALPKLREI